MVAIIGSIVAFIVAVLVGGAAIYTGARVITGEKNYGHAVITAVIGAIAWALTAWIPLIGLFVALFVWIGVINWRYKGGWFTAAQIGVIAWLGALVILFLVNAVLPVNVGAFGIPGI